MSRIKLPTDLEDWKVIIIGLFCASIIVTGALTGIILLGMRKTEVLEGTPLRQTENKLQSQAVENAKALDVFFARIEGITKSIGDFASKIWKQNASSKRPSFFHNSSLMHPIDYQYSGKHQQNVSFSYSGYKVAPEAYNSPSTYLNSSDTATFGNWSQSVAKTINLSVDLDLIFQPMYASMKEILWVYMGFSVGLHRSYPYHGPYDKEYDPRIRPWYLTALDTPTGKGAFTTPYVDASSGSVIVTSSYPVRNSTNHLIGVAGVDFKLTTIQTEVLAIPLQKGGRPWLINADFQIIAHPSHTLPNVTWEETDLQTLLTSLESTNPTLTTLLDQARNGKASQAVIDYGSGNGEQLVSVVPLNHSGLILGLSVPYSATPVTLSLENSWVVLLLGIFDLGLIGGLVVAYRKHRELGSEM